MIQRIGRMSENRGTRHMFDERISEGLVCLQGFSSSKSLPEKEEAR